MVGILVSIIVEVPWDFYVQYGYSLIYPTVNSFFTPNLFSEVC